MYPWKIPDGLVDFVFHEFQRFGVDPLEDRAIDIIGDNVMTYVAANHYYPSTQEEAISRYENPGLRDPELRQLLGPLEYHLKVTLRLNADVRQIHLTIWAALLYSWSENGRQDVQWYQTMVAPLYHVG